MRNKLTPIVVLCLSMIGFSVAAQSHRAGNPRGFSPDSLLEVFKLTQADSDVPFDLLMQACPRPDCIASIDQPDFVSANVVDYLRDDDLVISVAYNGITRAYPIRILDHHEIVNDIFALVPVAVTYCPLCGSGLAFERRAGSQVLEFGVSSLLHNSDLVMYDRQTNSLWQQITGKSFAGASRGSELKSVPASMVIWKNWRDANPGAEVLTVEGVNTDRYMKDAYGDYAESERLYMPISATDARLHPKRIVYALEIGDRALAFDGEWLEQQRRWSNEFGGKKLTVSLADDDGVIASLDGSPVAIHRMYWFAWYSFHPLTALIDGKSQ